jgi:copper chaperone CopZ
MTARTFGTTGMVCPACPKLLEKSLERLSGVTSAEADLRLGTTTVVFDQGVVTEWAIADAIHYAGFGVSLSRAAMRSGR